MPSPRSSQGRPNIAVKPALDALGVTFAMIFTRARELGLMLKKELLYEHPGQQAPYPRLDARGEARMFSFSNMFHFFAHELSRLSRRGFAFALVFTRPFNCFFFWHTKIVSPPLAAHLGVSKLWPPPGERVSQPVIKFGPNQLVLASRKVLMRSWAALMSVYCRDTSS
jgi:hypothetical protein